MKKTIIQLALGLAFFGTLTIASCKKQEIDPVTASSSSSSRVSVSLDNPCTDCCEGKRESFIENLQGITGYPFFTIYDNWNPVEDTLCGNGPQIQWEGQFNSFVKGSNGWNVSVLNSSTFPPSTDLSTIDCEDNIQNYILSGVTDNAVGSKTGGRVGYYSYANQVYNIENLIVVWKCCTEGANAGKIKFYVIKVTDIIPIGSGVGPYDSRVEYEYICAWCTATCPSLN